MNPKSEYLIDLIFKKLKNFKGKEILLVKESLKEFIFLLIKDNKMIDSEGNVNENINSKKEIMEIKFSCGEDGISEYLDDGWIIIKEDSQEKICTWKSIPASKDCDMEKDKGCKITTPDKIGEEKIYLLEKQF